MVMAMQLNGWNSNFHTIYCIYVTVVVPTTTVKEWKPSAHTSIKSGRFGFGSKRGEDLSLNKSDGCSHNNDTHTKTLNGSNTNGVKVQSIFPRAKTTVSIVIITDCSFTQGNSLSYSSFIILELLNAPTLIIAPYYFTKKTLSLSHLFYTFSHVN